MNCSVMAIPKTILSSVATMTFMADLPRLCDEGEQQIPKEDVLAENPLYCTSNCARRWP